MSLTKIALKREVASLKRQVNRLATELTNLRDALPKTADGVPVVPWMELWVNGHYMARARNIDENGDSNRFAGSYSTREAALANERVQAEMEVSESEASETTEDHLREG